MGYLLFGCSSMLDITWYHQIPSQEGDQTIPRVQQPSFTLWDDPMARVVPGDFRWFSSNSQPKSSNTGSLFERKHDGTTWEHISIFFRITLPCFQRNPKGVRSARNSQKPWERSCAAKVWLWAKSRCEVLDISQHLGIGPTFSSPAHFSTEKPDLGQNRGVWSVWDDWMTGDFGSKPGICGNHEHLWILWAIWVWTEGCLLALIRTLNGAMVYCRNGHFYHGLLGKMCTSTVQTRKNSSTARIE